MGLFDNRIKEELEIAIREIASLEHKLKLSAQSEIINIKKITTLENEITNLKSEIFRLEDKVKDLDGLFLDDKRHITNSKLILSQLEQSVEQAEKNLLLANQQLSDVSKALVEREAEFIIMDEAVLLQTFGLYAPKYSFATAYEYKERLTQIRQQQAVMIENKKAAICLKIWTIDGNALHGKKLTEDNIKQIIRSFNVECDDIVLKVKFNNYDANKKRIQKSFNTLNKLNEVNQIEIHSDYVALKFQELDLAFEYMQKVQEEKEELKLAREIQRENARVAKELEEERQRIEKEQQHYNNAMKRLMEQIDMEKDEERLILLLQKKTGIEDNLTDLEKALKEVDYREANQRAGYVYVISNIGAFGEDIYKIGMTRRLDPQDRVDELGGASVPFRFDVHALIFSDDAPRLENALHNAFTDKKINAMNNRKEFFKVSLGEIEEVVRKNHDKTVSFQYLPIAQQYRETLKIKSNA